MILQSKIQILFNLICIGDVSDADADADVDDDEYGGNDDDDDQDGGCLFQNNFQKSRGCLFVGTKYFDMRIYVRD